MPLELPVLRDFACDWYFEHKDIQQSSTPALHLFFSLFPSANLDITSSDERCNSPVIAKLAGEIITAARILNALVSEYITGTICADLFERHPKLRLHNVSPNQPCFV